MTLSRNAFGGKTPPVSCDDNPVLEAARKAVAEYGAAMDELAFSRALEALWRLLAEANQYIVAREPWKLIKTEGPSDGLSRVLWNGLEAVRIVASGLLPFMPETAPRVLRAIGVQEIPSTLAALAWGGLPNGAELPELQPLFRASTERRISPMAPPAPSAEAAGAGRAFIPKLHRQLQPTGLPKREQAHDFHRSIHPNRAAGRRCSRPRRFRSRKKLVKMTVDVPRRQARAARSWPASPRRIRQTPWSDAR